MKGHLNYNKEDSHFVIGLSKNEQYRHKVKLNKISLKKLSLADQMKQSENKFKTYDMSSSFKNTTAKWRNVTEEMSNGYFVSGKSVPKSGPTIFWE